jgi:hypothetical protein
MLIMKIYDISQKIFECAVWPGDPAPEWQRLAKIAEGSNYNLTAFSMCAHNGTHVDAPFHFLHDGKTVDQIDLSHFVGDCFVARHEGDVTAADAENIIDVIKAGLSEIPATSRLYEAVYDIIEKFENDVSQEECVAFIQNKYNEFDPHDSVHTITNALIVVIALLYGNGDFGKSICLAVQIGYDTDCNGATVGSVLGMLNGFDSIGEEWIKPLKNKLDTGITGMGVVEISDLVEKTILHIKNKE